MIQAAPESVFYTQWDFWVSIFTFALAVMTGWLALETRRLRKEADATSKAQRQYVEKTALANEALAKANFVGQRAWLIVPVAEIAQKIPESYSGEGLPWDIVVPVLNAGRTPAFEVFSRSGATVEPETPKQFPEAGQVIAQPMIGPGATISLHIDALQEEFMNLNELLEGTHQLFLFVTLTYKDAIELKLRKTSCLFAYDRDRKTFTVTREHNVID